MIYELTDSRQLTDKKQGLTAINKKKCYKFFDICWSTLWQQ